MATKKKLLQAAAGNAGGAGLDVDDVFSTYLYDGNGSTQTITNGIDLAGEGGLVWIKSRTGTTDNWLSDSERAYTTRFLRTNLTNAEGNNNASVTSYSADGFSVGAAFAVNTNNQDYASWTFLKSKRFFDIQTYTGDGANGREIAHNLGTTVGTVIIKCTSGTGSWQVWHREGAGSGTSSSGQLDSTAAFNNALVQYYFGDDTQKIDPTSTVFTVSDHSAVNASGGTYVAYLFAHNDGDGEFGPDGDADIVNCGSYTGTGSSQLTVDLGFEPQWLLVKRADATADWILHDTMRGFGASGNFTSWLEPNTSDAEATATADWLEVTSTGFSSTSTQSRVNASGGNYIYIAIRRGPLAPPESATDVFGISYAQNVNTVPFPVDFMLSKIMSGANGYARDRLRGGTKYLLPDTTNADLSGTDIEFDDMTGTGLAGWGTSFIHYNWKRAPNYMDVVAFDGGGAGDVVNHNLGVKPDLMMYKRRSATNDWIVYNSIDGANYAMFLNKTDARESQIQWWNNTEPTATNFTTGSKAFSGSTYIAYLFASLAGISKVGSVTHSGTTNVDCGFSAGSRFVLLKRTDATGDWYVWDSERGIVSGNDPYLLLNSTAAEVTNTDYIDPLSSGFTITSNFTAGDYIFYAIA